VAEKLEAVGDVVSCGDSLLIATNVKMLINPDASVEMSMHVREKHCLPKYWESYGQSEKC
jgi:hypothetical protein